MYLICHPLQTGRKAAIGDEPDGPFNEEKKPNPQNTINTQIKTPQQNPTYTNL